MAYRVFLRNGNGSWQLKIDADSFTTDPHWVTFFRKGGRLVAAIPYDAAESVEEVDD